MCYQITKGGHDAAANIDWHRPILPQSKGVSGTDQERTWAAKALPIGPWRKGNGAWRMPRPKAACYNYQDADFLPMPSLRPLIVGYPRETSGRYRH